MTRRGKRFFCGNNQPIPRDPGDGLTHDRLRPVALCGIEEINAQVDRLPNQRNGAVFRLGAITQSEPTGPAATQARDADLQSSLSERGVLHWINCDMVQTVPNVQEVQAVIKIFANGLNLTLSKVNRAAPEPPVLRRLRTLPHRRSTCSLPRPFVPRFW